MEVKHEQKDTKGTFYIEEKGARIAEMTYVFSGEKRFIIEHTLVNPEHEGKGLGKQLVLAGVAFARENGYKILPLCPYAKKVMERTDEYKDVLF